MQGLFEMTLDGLAGSDLAVAVFGAVFFVEIR
jgi:hypothetical protein